MSVKKDMVLSPKLIERRVSKTPVIALKNRFVDPNPVLDDKQVSLVSRPGLKKWIEVGDGPVRKLFSEPGTFDDDLFVVSGTFLYRVDRVTGSVTTIGELGSGVTSRVSMAAAAPVGNTGAFLWIAEGGVLWLYKENGNAIGHLEFTGGISNGDRVEINGTYYQFTTGSVDTGTPAGTNANPWLVLSTGSVATSIDNLYKAINDTGLGGVDYSTALTEHTTVSASSSTGSDLYVFADIAGTIGNAYTTTETGANMAWTAATLQNGGSPGMRQVDTPDANGAISVSHINSYIIVVPIQDEALGTVGRFYWVEPAEEVIDPLNFATAERSPDKIHQVVVFGDKFWLLGEKTTEPWITTGDPAAPMERLKGILFDRGSWEGTAIQVKESLIVIDEGGAVFQIGGGLQRISTPDIEEKIRNSIELQKFLGA